MQGLLTTAPFRFSMLGCCLAILAFSAPASAQEHHDGFTARVWAGSAGRYVLNDNDPFTSPGFGTAELKVNGSAIGFGGDIEYRASRWIGLVGAFGYTKFDVDFTTTNAPGTVSTQKFGVMPLMLALNLHVIHARQINVWVGPQIAYVMFPDNLSYAVGGSTFTYAPSGVFSKKGFVVGTDVRLGGGWALNGAFRWQDADGDSDSHLTVDPTFVTLGFAKRF